MMNDELGKRMKSQYEERTRFMLPRRTYTIIRIDGKAFHTFTRGFEKPFDLNLHTDLCMSAAVLCNEAQGCVLGYVQSDEASFLLTDFNSITTDAWFDGNVQKISSIAASIFTEAFSARHRVGARFDCRVFTIPDRVEVENYFIWRQKDAVRNSVLSVAQSLFSHKELHNKGQKELKELILTKGQDWENYPRWARNGSVIVRNTFELEMTLRHRWEIEEAPSFLDQRDWLSVRVPK